MMAEFREILDVVVKVVTIQYEAPVLFEHGASQCGLGGGCIDHAHLHVVPCSQDISDSLRNEFELNSPLDWSDLPKWRDKQYLFYSSNLGKKIICEPTSDIGSQFLRRQVARAVGRAELWNFRAHPGLQEMQHTIERLRPIFAMIHKQLSPKVPV
jgi:hypothetical protein